MSGYYNGPPPLVVSQINNTLLLAASRKPKRSEIWILRNRQTNKLRSAAGPERPVAKKRVIPVDCPEKEKYSTEPRLGMFSAASLGLPGEWTGSPKAKTIVDSIVGNLQASVSVGSWSNYATAYRNLERCSADLKI